MSTKLSISRMDKLYPTSEQLHKIQLWDFKENDIMEFLDYIKNLWQYVDLGFYRLTGKNILRLDLHTGGWSGNEDIIKSIKQNRAFWFIAWEKSLRGGHHYFKIKKKLF